MILSELIRTREALNNAIAYVEAEGKPTRSAARTKSIRIGEARAVAILASLRDSGGTILQREFEEICIFNCRTLVGAGGFIARGSIVREEASGGDIRYSITEKGQATINRWEARYGTAWVDSLEHPGILSNPQVHDHQKTSLITVQS